MISLMYEKFLRMLRAMELEEKVLHTGVLVCILGLFVPWIGGQWSGTVQQWSGFGFYTGYIGQVVLLLQLYIFTMTISPLLGGPTLVRKAIRNFVRLILSSLCTILLIMAFTVLLRLTGQLSGAEIRFGIYFAIVGSAIATLYAFLKYQEEQRGLNQAVFLHPDAQTSPKLKVTAVADSLPEDRPPPPPPPTPPPAEDHHLFSNQ